MKNNIYIYHYTKKSIMNIQQNIPIPELERCESQDFFIFNTSPNPKIPLSPNSIKFIENLSENLSFNTKNHDKTETNIN